MKSLRLVALIVGLIFVLAAVAVFGYRAANHYLLNSEASQPSCQRTYATHNVNILNGHVIPRQTTAKLCDKLTIIDSDHQLRLIAFGPHDDHTPYDGITERALNYGQSLTVTLVQTGNFSFHDHADPGVIGLFSVNN